MCIRDRSELAVQKMKDPYIFDFIPFKEDMVERDIEQALVQDVTKLLLELGDVYKRKGMFSDLFWCSLL